MNERIIGHDRSVSASWDRESVGDQTLEKNWLFQLRQERFRSRASGKVHDFYVLHLADSVNVVALTPDRQMILVEQFRAGSARDSLETPGGLLDKGEDPLKAGARELLEETGYAGDEPVLLGAVWSNPSILSSRNATIFINNARLVSDQNLDSGEEVRVELVPAKEIPQLIRNGRIGHALAVQGLLWWLVAEIPESPLQLPEMDHPRKRQFGLAKVMVGVAIIAVTLGILNSFSQVSTKAGLIGLYVALLPCTYFLAAQYFQPFPQTTLTQHLAWSTNSLAGKIFAMLGLNQVLWTIAALILLFFDVNINIVRFLGSVVWFS